MWRRGQGWVRQLYGARHAGAGTGNGGTIPFVFRQGRCEGHACVCLSVSLPLSLSLLCLCVSVCLTVSAL
jgi:hypothetical protein